MNLECSLCKWLSSVSCWLNTSSHLGHLRLCFNILQWGSPSLWILWSSLSDRGSLILHLRLHTGSLHFLQGFCVLFSHKLHSKILTIIGYYCIIINVDARLLQFYVLHGFQIFLLTPQASIPKSLNIDINSWSSRSRGIYSTNDPYFIPRTDGPCAENFRYWRQPNPP